MMSNFFRKYSKDTSGSDQLHQDHEQQIISNISRMHRGDNVVRRIYEEDSSSSYSPAEQAREIANRTQELARNLESSEKNLRSEYTALPRYVLEQTYKVDKDCWDNRNMLGVSDTVESSSTSRSLISGFGSRKNSSKKGYYTFIGK